MFPGVFEQKKHQRTNVDQKMPSLDGTQSIRTSLAVEDAPEPIGGSENNILAAGPPFDTDAMNDDAINCNIEEELLV